MRLDEYLEATGIKKVVFAKKVGISGVALRGILDGKTPNLRTALAIELATNGNVRCRGS